LNHPEALEELAWGGSFGPANMPGLKRPGLRKIISSHALRTIQVP
jgi:hypothetical protein